MKTEKELKARYLEELQTVSTWRDDPKMQDYCIKKCSVIVNLPSGWYYVIDKPHIETRFCYWYYNDSDWTDFNNAQEQAENARKDVENFMSENLSCLDHQIKELEEVKESWYWRRNARLLLLEHAHGGDLEECNEKSIAWYDERNRGDTEEARYNYFRQKTTKPTKEDIEALIQWFKEARQQFIKRLQTYLKRFWLSKVYSWTYWADA